MEKEKKKKALVRFVANSIGFNSEDKIKILALLHDKKRATYVHLRISKNTSDTHTFETLLKETGVPFLKSRACGFEEITKITTKVAKWSFNGIWIGYDLFKTIADKEAFKKYKKLVKLRRHKQADTLAGALYGYPACCVKRFLREHDPLTIGKKYKYSEFYQKLATCDKKYPFVAHIPCEIGCKKTQSLNKEVKAITKNCAKRFYKNYGTRYQILTQLVITGENDIIHNGKSVWKQKDAHEYIAIAIKKIKSKYAVATWFTKKNLPVGTIIEAIMTIRNNVVRLTKVKILGESKEFCHQRKFSKP